MKLLVIEDEVGLLTSILTYLRQEHYSCDSATSLHQAINKIESRDYDCVVLDIDLPDGSGLKILQDLKKNQKAEGVIIISAHNSIDDRLTGLKLGADDYLVKPFHLSELAARIAAIIRRKIHSGNSIVSFNEISIDTSANEVSIRDKNIELTGREYDLLLYLISNQGKVIPKHALIDHLLSEELDYGDNFDFIYTHIKNLRKKLQQHNCGDYIKSIYGTGYKLTDK